MDTITVRCPVCLREKELPSEYAERLDFGRLALLVYRVVRHCRANHGRR